MGSFGEIFRFEVVRAARQPSTWLYAGFLFLLGLLSTVTTDSGSSTYVNAPLNVAGGTLIMSLAGVLITAALFGDAANRDTQSGMDPLFYAAPISKAQYLGGRFLGALAVNACLCLVVPVSLAIAVRMPYMDPERLGPFRADAYVQSFLLFLLPNLLINAAVLFGMSALSRRAFPSYLGAMALFAGYMLAIAITSENDHAAWAPLLDPTGFVAALQIASDWTPVEENSLLLPLTPTLLLNRLLWLGLGLAVLVFTYARFRFSHHARGERRSRKKAVIEAAAERTAPVAAPAAPQAFGPRARMRQVAAIAGRSFREVLASRDFLVLALGLVGFIFAFGSEILADDRFGVPAWPLTQLVSGFLGGFFVATLVSLLTAFYAGELVWRERDARVHEIADAAPVPDWVPLAGKFLALAGMLAALQAVLMVSGMLLQAVNGFYRFEPGLYLRVLFGLQLVDYLLLAAVALLVHTLVNHKYLGHLLVLSFYLMTVFSGRMGIDHNLLVYGSDPGWMYSDMAGFGPYLAPFAWFKLYWAGWALLFAVLASLFWVRGTERGAARRLRQARLRFTRPMALVASVAVVQILALGGFVFYNTNVVNDYRTAFQKAERRAQYERRYKRHEYAPQPWVLGASLHVEIYPDEGRAEMRGTYRMVNRTGQPIDSVHLSLHPVVTARSIRFSRTARRVLNDEELGYRIFVLQRPLAPGDSLRVAFDVEFGERGFPHRELNTSVVPGGTFLTNHWFPAIGYQRDYELAAAAERREHGLGRRDFRPSIHDAQARRVARSSSHADFIQFEAVVGTAGGETAVAPGALRRTWTRNGRRYFHYQAEAPVLNFYGILSSDYAVHETRWNGVRIQVLHDPAHAFNVQRIADGARASLEYFSRSFGPYPHRQLRLVEFPRYQAFARAYPGQVVFSEGSSLMGRANDEQVDSPLMVTAHEVAHQWWGHQVMGADVQGSQMLSETLAQYGAMMILEKTYGPARVHDFLYSMQIEYLNRRGNHANPEVPLLLTGDHDYLHYRKGAVVMYTLRDYLGEEAVNTALRRFAQRHRYSGPPYPTSLDLYRELDAVTPDSLKPLLQDLVTTITLWDLRARSASAVPAGEGEYRVTLRVDAAKVRSDSVGNDTPAPMNDLVEIGVFGEGGNERLGRPLYLRKHRLAAGQHTITVTVRGRPVRAGIDPYQKLLTRHKEEMDAKITPVVIGG